MPTPPHHRHSDPLSRESHRFEPPELPRVAVKFVATLRAYESHDAERRSVACDAVPYQERARSIFSIKREAKLNFRGSPSHFPYYALFPSRISPTLPTDSPLHSLSTPCSWEPNPQGRNPHLRRGNFSTFWSGGTKRLGYLTCTRHWARSPSLTDNAIVCFFHKHIVAQRYPVNFFPLGIAIH